MFHPSPVGVHRLESLRLLVGETPTKGENTPIFVVENTNKGEASDQSTTQPINQSPNPPGVSIAH